MKPQGSNANAWDANIDMIDAALDWSEKYLNDLEVIQANRKLIIEEARSLHFQDQGKVVELCKYIETYLLATNQRDCSIAHLEGDNLLKDVSETIGTLTKNLEERTSELESEYARQITAVVRKSSFSSQDLSDVLAICREYSVIIELHKKIPSLRVKQFYIDLIKLSFIDDEKVYDSLLQQYTAAETPEGFKKLQRVLEEEVLTPFEKTKKSLQEKYSWQYTFRFLPGFAEYRLIDVELPERWKGLVEEVGTVTKDNDACLALLTQRQELEKAVQELQQLATDFPSPELSENYFETIQDRQRQAERLRFSSLPTSSRYLAEAVQHYQTAWETAQRLLGSASTTVQELVVRKLEELEVKDYIEKQELEQGLYQLQRIQTMTSRLPDSPLAGRAVSMEQKLRKASQGLERFSSLAGLQAYVRTSVEINGWPKDKIYQDKIHQEERSASVDSANGELERSRIYALITGIAAGGYHLAGTFWQRLEQVGVRPGKVVDVMALAAESVLPEQLPKDLTIIK
mgnify:CR=1 FL=1